LIAWCSNRSFCSACCCAHGKDVRNQS
jgi:hypothetical protein